MDKVSVIVPNYNAEKYIGDCIESLVNQTYKNVEIIIIDDCSNDNSVGIVKDYQKKYSNILLIELKKNKGVSNARNLGIKKASGEYIMFSDSDDFYELTAIQELVSAAEKRKSDFVIANYYINKENKKIKVDNSTYFSKDKIKKEEIISYMTLTSCSKLIKKTLFIQNNIQYPQDIKRCEELTVIPILAYFARKPIVIDSTLYNYCQRKGSASNNIINKNVDYFDITFNRFVEFLDKENYKDEIEFRAIEHFLYSKTLVMIKLQYSNKEIKKHIRDFKNKYPEFLNNKYLKKFSLPKKVFINALARNNILLARLITVLHKIITG